MAKRKKPEDPRSSFEKRKAFLGHWSDTFSVSRAAELAGIDRSEHYRWFRKDKKYAAAFKRRKETAADYLESEAIDRAGAGWLEPVYYQGAPCGEVRRFDSGLIQFLLRGMMPEKYGARTEISGPAGAPVQAKIEVVFVKPGDTSGDRQ
jgi:hypothetical protein